MVFFALIPFMQMVSCHRGASFRLVVVWTLLSVVFRFYPANWTPFFGRVGRFTYLYFITAWLKEAEGGGQDGAAAGPKGHFIARHAGLASIICCALLVFEACYSRYRVSKGLDAFSLYVGDYITLYLEFSLFYLFKRLHLKKSVFINAVAGTVFGVYLLHENFLWMSWKDHERFSILWDQLLRAGDWYENALFPVYYILSTLLVFAVCAAVEFVLSFGRRWFLKRLSFLDGLYAWIDGWYGELFADGR